MSATITKNVLFCFTTCLFMSTSGQSVYSPFEVGINAGVFIYQGDLTPERLGSYRTMKPVIGLNVSRVFNQTFAVRTNLAFGFLKGDDAKYSKPVYRQQRNLAFRSPVFEISALLVADIFGNNYTRQAPGLSPYVFAGGGFSIVNIRRDWSRFNAEYFSTEANTIAGLSADQQHAVPRVLPVIPLGVGVRFPVSSRISVNVETAYRFTFTDYLDGFSKAANDARKDSYQSHTVGVTYQFKKYNSLKCPVF